MATRPNVGDQAPPFQLPDTEGNLHMLSDFAGRPLVLVFIRHLG